MMEKAIHKEKTEPSELSELSESLRSFLRAHADDDVRQLALKADKYPEIDMPFALNQIAGRQTACHKLPTFAAVDGLLYPPHLSMEQCSSEQTARYKAHVVSRWAGSSATMADLTGGYGIDFYFMGRQFGTSTYVERQEPLFAIVRHNLALLPNAQHADFHLQCADGVEYLRKMKPVDLLYLDPARRDVHGAKTYALEDCTPDVAALRGLLLEKAPHVVLKLSPMFDWHQAVRQLEGVREVHIVSVANECKELLLVLSREPSASLSVTCVNDSSILTFDDGEASVVYQESPVEAGQYLYEPNASLMKSGLFGKLCERYGVRMIGRDSHLFVSSSFIKDFPGRQFQIEAFCSLKEARQILRNMEKANITVRNFPMSVQELRKRLKLKDGGDSYLFATTLQKEAHTLIICKKVL